jgi:nicotinamidase/pyrazinamidase
MIFFDVDTQRDFIDADGALAVPEAETIKPNLERLLQAAEKHRITTISSRCAHEPGDAEFEIFPPHCLDGTPGAERIFADLPALHRTEIPVDASADPQAKLAVGEHYIVKKKVFDLFSNAWLNDLRQRDVFSDETCVVFGVATDYCVRACVLGLAETGARIQVVEDAIRGVAAETTAQTIAEMRDAGVEFTTTDEVLNKVAERLTAA